jgi:hypothetical protein
MKHSSPLEAITHCLSVNSQPFIGPGGSLLFSQGAATGHSLEPGECSLQSHACNVIPPINVYDFYSSSHFPTRKLYAFLTSLLLGACLAHMIIL